MSIISSRRRKVVNYLGNKELLREIHKSKLSYSDFPDPKYSDFDIIVEDLNLVVGDLLEQAKINRANRLNTNIGDKLFADGLTNKEIEAELRNTSIKANQINKEDIVVRLLTKQHIPEVPDRKGKMVKYPVNFPPFQHYIWKDESWVVVGQSHYKNGEFVAARSGKISNGLAIAFMKLVDKYASRGNWRGYSWIDEMKGAAITRLVQAGLTFNEYRSDNPFAYFTQIIKLSFTGTLNTEKKNVKTISRMMQDNGYAASFSDQADQDLNSSHILTTPKLVKSDDD